MHNTGCVKRPKIARIVYHTEPYEKMKNRQEWKLMSTCNVVRFLNNEGSSTGNQRSTVEKICGTGNFKP